MRLSTLPFLAALATPATALAQTTTPTPAPEPQRPEAARRCRAGLYGLFAQSAHYQSVGALFNPTCSWGNGTFTWSGEFHLRTVLNEDLRDLTSAEVGNTPGVRTIDSRRSAIGGEQTLDLSVYAQTMQYVNARLLNLGDGGRFQLFARLALGAAFVSGDQINTVTEPVPDRCRPGNGCTPSAATTTTRSVTTDYYRWEIIPRAVLRASLNFFIADKPEQTADHQDLYPRRDPLLNISAELIVNGAFRVDGAGSDESVSWGGRFPVTLSIPLDPERHGNSRYAILVARPSFVMARNAAHVFEAVFTGEVWAGVRF